MGRLRRADHERRPHAGRPLPRSRCESARRPQRVTLRDRPQAGLAGGQDRFRPHGERNARRRRRQIGRGLFRGKQARQDAERPPLHRSRVDEAGRRGHRHDRRDAGADHLSRPRFHLRRRNAPAPCREAVRDLLLAKEARRHVRRAGESARPRVRRRHGKSLRHRPVRHPRRERAERPAHRLPQRNAGEDHQDWRLPLHHRVHAGQKTGRRHRLVGHARLPRPAGGERADQGGSERG